MVELSSHRPGPGLPPSPTPFCFAADSLFSRDEWLSRPSHRPGPGLPPSPTPFVLRPTPYLAETNGLSRPSHRPGPGCRYPRLRFYNAADDDSIAMPDADSAVPQSPVSGNVPSARGLPWWAPGPAALPVSEGCSVGSRSCPLVLYFPWPAQRPTRLAPYRPYYWCIRAVHFLRPL